MKFVILLKDADSFNLSDSIGEAVWYEMIEKQIDPTSDYSKEWRKSRKQEIADICHQWFLEGGYIQLEVDTDTRSIRVMNASDIL